MVTIKEKALQYEKQKTKNITDLNAVSVEFEVVRRNFKDKDDKPFSVDVALINGEEYRVPASVLENLKAILEEKPELKTFKVTSTGTGMNTRYTVIPLG